MISSSRAEDTVPTSLCSLTSGISTSVLVQLSLESISDFPFVLIDLDFRELVFLLSSPSAMDPATSLVRATTFFSVPRRLAD